MPHPVTWSGSVRICTCRWRIIELPRARLSGASRSLGTTSKINRDPAFLREFMGHGEALAEEFFTALAFEDTWRSEDTEAVLSFFADDAEVVSAPPITLHGPSLGPAAARPFLHELTKSIRVDTTRKQIARDRVTWTVRSPNTASITGADDHTGTRIPGRAEAAFNNGKLTSLRLDGEASQPASRGGRREAAAIRAEAERGHRERPQRGGIGTVPRSPGRPTRSA
jgi:hypothetical protein